MTLSRGGLAKEWTGFWPNRKVVGDGRRMALLSSGTEATLFLAPFDWLHGGLLSGGLFLGVHAEESLQ